MVFYRYRRLGGYFIGEGVWLWGRIFFQAINGYSTNDAQEMLYQDAYSQTFPFNWIVQGMIQADMIMDTADNFKTALPCGLIQKKMMANEF